MSTRLGRGCEVISDRACRASPSSGALHWPRPLFLLQRIKLVALRQRLTQQARDSCARSGMTVIHSLQSCHALEWQAGVTAPTHPCRLCAPSAPPLRQSGPARYFSPQAKSFSGTARRGSGDAGKDAGSPKGKRHKEVAGKDFPLDWEPKMENLMERHGARPRPRVVPARRLRPARRLSARTSQRGLKSRAAPAVFPHVRDSNVDPCRDHPMARAKDQGLLPFGPPPIAHAHDRAPRAQRCCRASTTCRCWQHSGVTFPSCDSPSARRSPSRWRSVHTAVSYAATMTCRLVACAGRAG